MTGKLYVLMLIGALLLQSGCDSPQTNTNRVSSLEVNDHKSGSCYFFFITDCPASRNNLPKVQQLHVEFQAQEIEMIGVVSDPRPDLEALEATIEQFGLGFEIVLDSNLSLTRHHSATVTPQAVLYNVKDEMIYTGQIDNYYYDFGRHRPEATVFLLRDAIVAMLAGKEAPVRQTAPIGCAINFNYLNSSGLPDIP